MVEPLLKWSGLTKTVEDGGMRRLLWDCSAEIRASERIVLTGPSGQGKSTLLRLLALLDEPDSGELRLEGTPASQWEPRQWRRTVCYVSQQPVMLGKTVADNLETASRLHQTPFDRAYAEQLMSEAGLEGMDWGKGVDALSGGEKQRVALVRSLLLRPKLFLLDEITASLDESNKAAVERILDRIHREDGTGYIWITHDVEQAKRIADRSFRLSGGVLTEGD